MLVNFLLMNHFVLVYRALGKVAEFIEDPNEPSFVSILMVYYFDSTLTKSSLLYFRKPFVTLFPV